MNGEIKTKGLRLQELQALCTNSSVLNDQDNFARPRVYDHYVLFVDEVAVVTQIWIPLHDNGRQGSKFDAIGKVHADRDAADAKPHAGAQVDVSANEYPVI